MNWAQNSRCPALPADGLSLVVAGDWPDHVVHTGNPRLPLAVSAAWATAYEDPIQENTHGVG